MTKTTKMPRRTLSFPPDTEKYFKAFMKDKKSRSFQVGFEELVSTHAVMKKSWDMARANEAK